MRGTIEELARTSPNIDRAGSSMTELVHCSDQTMGTGSHLGPRLVRTVETTGLNSVYILYNPSPQIIKQFHQTERANKPEKKRNQK